MFAVNDSLCKGIVLETVLHLIMSYTVALKENSSIVSKQYKPDLNEGWAKAKSALDLNITKYAHKETGSAEMIMPNNTFRLTTAMKPGNS